MTATRAAASGRGTSTAARSPASRRSCATSPTWASPPSTSTPSSRRAAITATTRPTSCASTTCWARPRTSRRCAARPRSTASLSCSTACSITWAPTRARSTATTPTRSRVPGRRTRPVWRPRARPARQIPLRTQRRAPRIPRPMPRTPPSARAHRLPPGSTSSPTAPTTAGGAWTTCRPWLSPARAGATSSPARRAWCVTGWLRVRVAGASMWPTNSPTSSSRRSRARPWPSATTRSCWARSGRTPPTR